MASYCEVSDVQLIVPKTIIIGQNKQRGGSNATIMEVQYWIDRGADVIDSYLSTFYRIPIVKYKEPDFTVDPVTFVEKYPQPLVLINARLSAANVFDNVFMSQQEPNVSEWGKNQRSLAFDDLKGIQAGHVRLLGQEFKGLRFVRMELLDPARIPSKETFQVPSRQPGQ